jgi:hypothetical protein
LSSFHLLWSLVDQSATIVFDSLLSILLYSQTEIHDFAGVKFLGVIDDYVAWLYISMNKLVPVDMSQSLQEPSYQIRGILVTYGSFSLSSSLDQVLDGASRGIFDSHKNKVGKLLKLRILEDYLRV